jgi:hypothetical protein
MYMAFINKQCGRESMLSATLFVYSIKIILSLQHGYFRKYYLGMTYYDIAECYDIEEGNGKGKLEMIFTAQMGTICINIL